MNVLPYFGYSLYQMFHLFMFWSVIGWGIEVCYMTLETGKYQNRGFLNMPMCPIYGFGVLMVAIVFRPISNNIFMLFLMSGISCTLLELFVGLGMELLFHNRWWDYSHEKFNYKGYICLKISLIWGLGGILVIKIIHPLVERYVDMLPETLGLILIAVFSALIIMDLLASVSSVVKLNARLKQIDEISKIMLKSAVKIGENLSNETLEMKNRYEKIIEVKDNAAQELREKYENFSSEIRERYEKILNMRDATTERWLKAFPNMRSTDYSDSMEKLKEHQLERLKKNLASRIKGGSSDKDGN